MDYGKMLQGFGLMTSPLRNSVRSPSVRLGPEAWIDAGNAVLKAWGVGAVKVEPLATRLGVTTGSFYWHFKDRPALLTAMLDNWEGANSAGFFKAVSDNPGDFLAQFDAIVRLWLDEETYSSTWDAAVRDWARIDADVQVQVRRVDECRIALLQGIFLGLGFADVEALVRARVTYFHQVGYYAMGISESMSDRLALKPLYTKVLLGLR